MKEGEARRRTERDIERTGKDINDQWAQAMDKWIDFVDDFESKKAEERDIAAAEKAKIECSTRARNDPAVRLRNKSFTTRGVGSNNGTTPPRARSTTSYETTTPPLDSNEEEARFNNSSARVRNGTKRRRLDITEMDERFISYLESRDSKRRQANQRAESERRQAIDNRLERLEISLQRLMDLVIARRSIRQPAAEVAGGFYEDFGLQWCNGKHH